MTFGHETFGIDARAAYGRGAQPAGGVSVPGKQSVTQPYDPLMDLESTRSMEERYGIREGGIF